MAGNLLAEFFAKFTIEFDKSTLNNIESGMNKGKDSVDKFGKSIENISSALDKLKYAVLGFVGIQGIKEVFNVNTEINNSLNQIVNAVKSTEIAHKQLEKVVEFANKSRMSILGMTSAFAPFQNQMSIAGISAEKSIEIFKKLQIAYAGANLPSRTQQLVQKSVTEFIMGTATMSELKNRELGSETAIVMEIEKKLGGRKQADDKLKNMKQDERAELISDVAFNLYKDGQQSYLKGPMAALQNVKNQFALISTKIGESGFMQLAVICLDAIATSLKALNPLLEITSAVVNGVINAFQKAPGIMWSVVAVIGALTIALNANKIAMLANIVVKKVLIIVDNILAVAAGTATIAEALMALPLWLIVAGVIAVIAVIGLLVEDIYTYFEGGDSVFGSVIEKLKEIFNSFLAWFSKLGEKISRWIYDNTIKWVNKFANFGMKISNWLYDVSKKWVNTFADFGKNIYDKISKWFTIVKDFLFSLFLSIKNKYFEYVIEPILNLASKIPGKIGESFENIKTNFLNITPKVNQLELDNIVANLTPKLETYRDYKSSSPTVFPLQKPSNKLTSHYSPNLNINVTSNNNFNENELASKISQHVTDALDSHYSLSLADAAGGG
jgi:hypothetical protein